MKKNARILIADDFQLIRMILKRTLSELGVTDVCEVTNGREALQKIKDTSATGQLFDLVLCDWNMPEMNGIDVLNEVRGMPEFKKLLFVMVTSESEISFVNTALSAGAVDYIVKPFTLETVKAKVESLLNRIPKAA